VQIKTLLASFSEIQNTQMVNIIRTANCKYYLFTRKKVMNSEKFQQLQDEINHEMQEIMKNSNFGQLLEKHGVLGQKVFKLQCILDRNQLQSDDTNEGQQAQEFWSAIPDQEIMMSEKALCIPCPLPGHPYPERGCPC
jgi:hypothetical protein